MDDVTRPRGDILLVDDHPPSLQVLSAILSKQGHEIRAVVSGKMALLAAHTEPPDLVLLDVKLPDMDGYEVCRQLKSDERLRGVPVIFISSPETSYDKIHAFEVGAVDYITKPFQIDDVVARVESQLTLRRIYQQANIVAMIHERERLSRDLHDAVNQTIFSISMISEMLLYQAKEDAPQFEQGLAQIHQLSRIALSELRILLFELRPDNLLRSKLSDLFRQLTKTLSIRVNIKVELILNETVQLPPNVHLTFYRIAQEALNNIIKHAQANEIIITLDVNKHTGQLIIQDNGQGFEADESDTQGFGLRNMQERAKSINADFIVTSTPQTGTKLTLFWQNMGLDSPSEHDDLKN
jgi:signal transduction histidine kinase